MPCPGCGGAEAAFWRSQPEACAEAAFCIPAPQKLPDKVAVDVEAFLNQLQSMYDKRIMNSEQWSLMHKLAGRHPPVILTVRNMERRPQPPLWFNYHAPEGKTSGSFLQVRE